MHGDLVGRFVVRIECDRLLRGGERTCWVAVVDAEVSELAEEVDDRCVEAAHDARSVARARARAHEAVTNS